MCSPCEQDCPSRRLRMPPRDRGEHESQGFQKSGRRAGAPTADIWGLIFSTSQDLLLVEEIFWHVVAVT